VFAKADPRVAQFYETGLVPKALWGFGGELRKKFQATKTVLLKARRARVPHQGFVRIMPRQGCIAVPLQSVVKITSHAWLRGFACLHWAGARAP